MKKIMSTLVLLFVFINLQAVSLTWPPWDDCTEQITNWGEIWIGTYGYVGGYHIEAETINRTNQATMVRAQLYDSYNNLIAEQTETGNPATGSAWTDYNASATSNTNVYVSATSKHETTDAVYGYSGVLTLSVSANVWIY